MKTEKKDILKVLQKVKPGLAKKAIIEQFTHYLFTGNEIMTYNDEICICHPFTSDFKCSVKADDLWKLLSGLHEEGLILQMDGSELVIKSSKTEAGLSTIVDKDAEEMIDILRLKELEGKWIDLPEEGQDFLRGARLCMFSASRDMTKGVSTCIHIKDNIVESSDSVRISLYEMEKSLNMETLIPARCILELIHFDVIQYCPSESWMHFRTKEGVTFSTRIMEGDYPDVISYFEVEGASRARLPKELKSVIDSIAFMTEGEVDLQRSIELEVGKDMITLDARKKIGWVQKFVDFDHKQKPFKISINPMFLSQVLEKATTIKVSENVALFVSGNFKHIISLHSDEVAPGGTLTDDPYHEDPRRHPEDPYSTLSDKESDSEDDIPF